MALRELDCHYKFQVKKVGSDTFIEGWANKAVVDRGKDIIQMDAWQLDNYKKVPMILFNHDKDKPVGKAVDVRPTDQGLYIKAKISNSKDPTISMVRDLVQEGILNAFSVGFDAQDEQQNNEGINEIKQAELYECSIVTLPMNQDSTFAVSTKGLKTIGKDEFRKKVLQAKGAWVAEAIHGKLYDMEKSGTKRDDILSQIADGAGITTDDLTDILAGNVTPVPENILESFAKVLGLDIKKLQKLDAGDVKVSQEGQQMNDEPKEKDASQAPEQVALIGILVPKEQAQDPEAAKQMVTDAGYSPVDVQDQSDNFYVLLEDPSQFKEGTSQIDLGNGVMGIVGLRAGEQKTEEPPVQPEANPEEAKGPPPPPPEDDPESEDKKPPAHPAATPPPADKPAASADSNPPAGQGEQPKPAQEEDPAKLKEEYDQFKQDQDATVSGKPGDTASWVADEALWEQAKKASEAAVGKIDYAFVVWWYLQHGGSKKSESSTREKRVKDGNTAPISGGGDANIPIDDNPYLAQARQTNVLLGVLIKTVQEMCAVMQGGAIKPAGELSAPAPEAKSEGDTMGEDDLEKQVVANLRAYSIKLEEKLKKIGA